MIICNQPNISESEGCSSGVLVMNWNENRGKEHIYLSNVFSNYICRFVNLIVKFFFLGKM